MKPEVEKIKQELIHEKKVTRNKAVWLFCINLIDRIDSGEFDKEAPDEA